MVRFTFISNFLNHHQLPFCLEMRRYLGEGFHFVATEPIHCERKAMGYADMNRDYSFVLRTYEGEKEAAKARELVNTCEVAIIGSAPHQWVLPRILANKLTFRYSERIFKKGRRQLFSPSVLKLFLWEKHRFTHKQFYLLCASAYAAGDYAMLGAFRGKAFKWGYFPESKAHDLKMLMANKAKNPVTILWAGRFLELKHPEKALVVAHWLNQQGIDFHLKMIGGGNMEGRLKAMAMTWGIGAWVTFCGFMSPEKVRKEMEDADIYLFTSDANEGWGAVLNEAMNSGCAVVASRAIGSVPFLIQDGVNGMVYPKGGNEILCRQTMRLIQDPVLRQAIGCAAARTISDQWNAAVAAKRLLLLADELMAGKDATHLFSEGPCSRAEPSPRF